MKILHILDHSLPLHSGYTFRSENVFKCQQQAGCEVIVVTSPKHEESLKNEALPIEKINGVSYHRTGIMDKDSLPFVAEWKLIRKLKQKIISIARKEKPDILHAHSPVLNALAALSAAKELKIPVVYEIRAFWEDAAVDHGTYKEWGLKYRIVRTLETYACRKVDKVLTICEGLRNELISRGIPLEKIGTVPNAIDPDNFIPIERNEKNVKKWGLEGAFVVGFIGSFYHYEGLDLLVEAINQLKETIPNIKLLLVGGGTMEQKLKKLADNLGLNDRVIFTGRLPHEEIPVMYSLLNVLALPRKPMRLTELVTPLKPLEAMCMKRLVLASDVGGHKELIQDKKTGCLFQAGNIDSMVKVIKDLHLSKYDWKKITDRAHHWAITTRNWENNAQIYQSIYSKL